MHDVTEGGILGAIWEMCQIAKVGAHVWGDEVLVADVTKKICKYYGIQYMRLISSGSMIIMAKPEKKDEIIKKLAVAGVAARVIGQIVPEEDGLTITENGVTEPIDPPRPDELYKVVK